MVFQRGRRGRRPDLGNGFFDSSGEANFARILDLLQIKYERGHRINIEKLARKYEFKHTERHHYLKEMRPDFYLPDSGTHLEVKPAGMTVNDRMRYHIFLRQPLTGIG